MTTNLNERAKMRDDILALAGQVMAGKVHGSQGLRSAILPVRAYRDHLLTPVEIAALNDVEYSSSALLTASKLNAVAAMMLARDAAMKEDGFVMEASIDGATIHGESLAASRVYYPHLLAEVEKLQRWDMVTRGGSTHEPYETIAPEEDGDYVRLEDVLRVLGGGNA